MVGDQKATLQKYALNSGLPNARKNAPSGVRLQDTKPTVSSKIGKIHCKTYYKFSGRRSDTGGIRIKKDTKLGTNRIGFAGGKQGNIKTQPHAPEMKKAPYKDGAFFCVVLWCPGRDSNPHAR